MTHEVSMNSELDVINLYTTLKFSGLTHSTFHPCIQPNSVTV
uniref:Uncharacterized protein n=1 Tax=Arundo donax TaxID=35708 RepID=A0A0A9ARH9_ARUDO